MSKRNPYSFVDVQIEGQAPFWASLEAKRKPEERAIRAVAEFPEGVGPIDESSVENSATALQSLADASAAENSPEATRTKMGRRGFLTAAAAATAVLGVEGCIRRPEENILPYTQAPEYLNPGVPLHFATVLPHNGEAVGLIVESHEGRPTKIEGNPSHPASFGATDLRIQAQIMDLYDPDRNRQPTVKQARGRDAKSFADFDTAFSERIASHRASGGEGLRFLAPPSLSPTFARLRDRVLATLPNARFHTWTPVHHDNALNGAKIAFGDRHAAHFDYAQARVILALDSDFLASEPGAIAAMKRFADGRRLTSPQDEMSRLYVVEPSMTVTGANADHRLRLPARDVERHLHALAAKLAAEHGVDLGPIAPRVRSSSSDSIPAPWIDAVAADLAARKGQSIIVVGSGQPARVHALALALNAALGNLGRTVRVLPAPVATDSDLKESIGLLADQIGTVRTLVILGGNPALDAPANLQFHEKIASVEMTIHLGDRLDETGRLCTWSLPKAHGLETWGDQRALDGTIAIQQPLIAPLWGGRSEIELLAHLAGVQNWRGHYLVRETAKGFAPALSGFESFWRRVLHGGVIEGSGVAPIGVAPRLDAVAESLSPVQAKALSLEDAEIVFRPCLKMFDGRSINNPWLLELPDPITKIAWDNVAYISPRTAEALHIRDGAMIRIQRGDAHIELPAWTVPGQADFSITLFLGWGREDVGRYGSKTGFNVYPLRTADALHFADGAKITSTGASYPIAQTQEHHAMEGRPIAIDATYDEYKHDPEFAGFRRPTPKVLPLWKEVEYQGHRWGMSIDLNACTGCMACVAACIAENNTPIVGKTMLSRGREMHWLRLDRYFIGADENDPTGVAMQPVACQHCEEAPCENVCPVNATAHSPEGLNEMAYNRCIGTRYCMNNCPYKVRRFNYLHWNEDLSETEKMGKNPNVTVRFRGVMEKCTYCVQRIEGARIATRLAGRPLRDGDIRTACEQVCPAQAITFGDLGDSSSRVSRLSSLDRQYKLLSDIGTQPRTTYLAKVRNLNPAMTGARGAAAEGHGT